MINLQEIQEKANKVNQSVKKLLKRDSLSPNLDLVSQIQNQVETFKLLNQLKKQCQQQNLKVLMLTFVAHHTKSDSLDKTYKILKKSTEKLFRSIQWKNFVSLLGVRDYIKRLEIDYNDATGWHPHLHILLISDYSIAIESVEKYQKIFSDKYLKCCISSGMTCTTKTKSYMQEYGFKLTSNFEYLGYISDYRKLLKPRIANLSERHFSPYQMATYEGYESKYKEFAKFLKNKKIFEFSRPSICAVPFGWREIDKTKHLKPVKFPDLSQLQTTGYYTVQAKRYWHIVFQFLPDKMLKHYCYHGLDYKKFKIWLCFLSGIDWWNFYRYIKEFKDSDIFSVKRKSEKIPSLVVQLVQSYEEFLCNICTLEYRDPFLYMSCSQLIEEYENRKELEEIKFSYDKGKLTVN